MRHFWTYQVRYRAAKHLLEAGLWILPEGKYKTDLLRAMQQAHGKLLGIRDRKSDYINALIQRVRLAHDAGAGFHLSEEEMTALLDAAQRR